MTAFDTNILTEILLGNELFVLQAAAIPLREQAVPVVVVEELLRGRLNVIRQAEAGKARVSLARAYELFQETFADTQRLRILSSRLPPRRFASSGASRASALHLTIYASPRSVSRIPPR